MSMCGSNSSVEAPVLLLTVDVEDWFQVENFKKLIPFSSWGACESRIEENTKRLLDLLDSFGPGRKTGEGKVRATFFILGWLAQRFPELIREIRSRGHEIASHGFLHNLCNLQTLPELREDLQASKKLLEDITGVEVKGYRAPSFSINDDVLHVVEECGYDYDSSYNSFALHGRYGSVRPSQNGKQGVAIRLSPGFFELPISNLQFGRVVIPWGGGGYFRLIPSPLFQTGVRSKMRKEGAYLFYVHPWEIDLGQPRVEEAPGFFRFRHYHNLARTEEKLKKFITAFRNCRFLTCGQYLDNVTQDEYSH